MNILIFENEYLFIQTAFEYVKDIYFNGQISYTVCPNSQDIRQFHKMEEFDFIFIDISLGTKSELDGFAIIKKIENELWDKINPSKITIITGNHLIESMLKERGIQRHYTILTKPIDFNDLLGILKQTD